MNKIFFVIIILFSLILYIKSDDDDDLNDYLKNYLNENTEDSDEDDDDEETGYFKSSLKDYLFEKKLLKSEKIIEPKEMKEIFLNAMTEGGPENSPVYLRKIFSKLADFFVEKYYKEKKEIRGKDVYNLFNFKEILPKFDEIVGDSPLYGEDDEEEEDYDSRDSIGEPKTEL